MAKYAQDVPSDLNEMLADIKKADSIKRDFMLKHINSKNEQNREMAKTFKEQLDNDTSVMLETSEGTGKRIGKDGKVYGPVMKKEDSGLYKKEVPVKKAKGGMIKSSASKRADGCALRGKTRA
jgi:hypothetical protein